MNLRFGVCKASTAEVPMNRALFSHSKAVIVLLWFPDFSVVQRQEGNYKCSAILDRGTEKLISVKRFQFCSSSV